MVSTLDEALDIIYSHVDYSMTHQQNVSKDVFTLESMKDLCKKIGDPQNQYATIHVAGTKGKGSVCAMLAAALQNAGYRTGLYTSPHLIRINERFLVNGRMITDQELIDLTNRIDKSVKTLSKVSSFEFMTAIAFEFFKEQKVDIAVIETGLGGRLDSTNIIDPILSIITSISLDHTSFLGDSVEKIAAEKAGIIKQNVPVICSCQPYPEAAEVVRKAALEKKAPWIYVPDRYRFINNRENGRENMTIWRVENQKLMEKWCQQPDNSCWAPENIAIPLYGFHQIQNAATVYAAINKLKSRFEHLDISKALEGISKTFWPCRFERISKEKPLVLDGAHNIDSIQKLCAVMDRYFGTKEITCVFGASEDKDLSAMITELAPHVDRFIMTRSTHPRAADPKLLASIASSIGRKNQIAETLEDAFSIYENSFNENSCFLVTGSLFVAGGFRELYMNKDSSIPYFK